MNYYHVLRTHNKEADLEANKATLLSTGVKMKDEEESWESIPYADFLSCITTYS